MSISTATDDSLSIYSSYVEDRLETDLFNAVITGDIRGVRACMNHPDITIQSLETTLQFAAASGYTIIAKDLMARLNEYSPNMIIEAFSGAVQGGQHEIVRAFVQHHNFFDKAPRDAVSRAIVEAAEEGRSHVLRELLQCERLIEANPRQLPMALWSAAYRGKIECIRILLAPTIRRNQTRSISIPSRIHRIDLINHPMLGASIQIATQKGFLPIVQELLNHRDLVASIPANVPSVEDSLSIAVEKRRYDILTTLLNSEAFTEHFARLSEEALKSILEEAVDKDDAELVRMLLTCERFASRISQDSTNEIRHGASEGVAAALDACQSFNQKRRRTH